MYNINTRNYCNTFPFQPFKIGDKVYVEGIVKNSAHGTGFNSEDYGFKFLNVTGYDNTGINDKVELSVSGLSTNTGIAIQFKITLVQLLIKMSIQNLEYLKNSLNFLKEKLYHQMV